MRARGIRWFAGLGGRCSGRRRLAGMGGETLGWSVHENTSKPLVLALYLRQAIGLRYPDEVPALRGAPVSTTDAAPALEAQWRPFWEMTVDPTAHHSDVPLDLVDGFSHWLALPATGAEELRAAFAEHAAAALAYAKKVEPRSPTLETMAAGGRGMANAVAAREKELGRPAHDFELRLEVLPLTQRGLWWIGPRTVAVTDGLRQDVVAFDTAIQPIIAELA